MIVPIYKVPSTGNTRADAGKEIAMHHATLLT